MIILGDTKKMPAQSDNSVKNSKFLLAVHFFRAKPEMTPNTSNKKSLQRIYSFNRAFKKFNEITI